ncbi:MAG TPA: hypothetical protein PLP25_00605 [Candidatus Limiplasma sp.]|nr:hypothetical protein [Candidatus Limiplasma sp.]HPS80343.1 hypothetical protein [Candidatus Limiplasma sp.]
MAVRIPANVSTGIVIDQINQGAPLEDLPQARELPKLSTVLNEMMGKRSLSTEALFERAALNRATGFKVLANRMIPSPNVLLRLALVLQLDIDETQWLLKCGHHAQLSASRARDIILLKAVHDHLSIDEVDQLLLQNGQPTLLK